MTNKTNFPKKGIRILIPAVLLIIWLSLGGLGGPTFGKINSVSNNNEGAFLPKSSESTKVQNIQSNFQKTNVLPAILLFTSQNKLTINDIHYFRDLSSSITSINGVKVGPENPIIGPVLSKNKTAAQIIVPTAATPSNGATISAIQTLISRNKPSNLKSYVTGAAGIISAFGNAFKGINGILTYVAIMAVLVILLIVYRSIFLPFLVLLTSIFALSAAIFVVYNLTKHNILQLNGESQGILSILVIGASTDYSILIISRYKESLHKMKSTWNALASALKSAWEPITAAATTVIIALFCLLFSELNSNRSLGPVAAIGIAASYLAAMTFLPSVLSIFGRKAFWPIKIKVDRDFPELSNELPTDSRLWKKIAQIIKSKHQVIWISCFIVLALFAIFGVPQYRASGVSQSQSILGSSQAVKGFNILPQYFPAGSGSPVEIIARQQKASAVLSSIKHSQDISSATIFESGYPIRKIKVINDQVLISATLKINPQSKQAQNLITNLRSSLKRIDPSVLVGGTTAIQLDTNNAAKQDLKTIIPIVLVVILIILIIVLRSLVAPFILIISVILSYAATIGISALVFNNLFNFPGSDPSVPLFGFIFLVALGVDYNIFLITRVREESLKHKTLPGILRGLSVTGNVITSAGIVLAATFAALGVIPILFLAEIAFIVAFGVLLDTIIVRTFLVPSFAYQIAKYIWWPNKKEMK